MVVNASGTFDVVLSPAEPEMMGSVNRFELAKTFRGDLDGTGTGVLLSGGDPGSGAAGYVAIETFVGSLGGRVGGFLLQQFGTMFAGAQDLHYAVVPGSGHGDLSGIVGDLLLTVDDDGTHHYELHYEL